MALAIFIAAGVTDILDGYLARIWDQQSNFGRMLDPIADKLLVSSCLLMLAADGTIRGWSLWAAIVILCREILVSGLREYLAELRVGVPVTRLAKWKTTAAVVAIGFLLAGEAGDAMVSSVIGSTPYVTMIGLTLLWISALRDALHRLRLFRAGVKHSDRMDCRLKLVYFAWVRERIGKAEEEVELPADVRTVGDSSAG